MSTADYKHPPSLDGLALMGAEASAQGAAGVVLVAPALFSKQGYFTFWIVEEVDLNDGYLWYRYVDAGGPGQRLVCHMENAAHWQPHNEAARVLRAAVLLLESAR